jgi:hypothetical protein
MFGVKRTTFRVLVVKMEGKRPLGRFRHRWEDNMKMELKEIGWGGIYWIHLVYDREQWRALVTTLMK